VLEGLDPTRFSPSHAKVEPLSDLEPTRDGPVEAPPQEDRSWVDSTSFAPVAVAVEPMEVERLARADERTSFAPPTCRYCRTPALQGDVFCPKCGMHLAPLAAAAEEPPASVRRCRACGASVTQDRCPECGVVVRSGDEPGEP